MQGSGWSLILVPTVLELSNRSLLNPNAFDGVTLFIPI